MVGMISSLRKSQPEAEPEIDSALALLVTIDEAGMLDSFVLLNQTDAGICSELFRFSVRPSGRARSPYGRVRRAQDRLNLQQTPGKRGSERLRSFYTGIPKFTLRGKLQPRPLHLKS